MSKVKPNTPIKQLASFDFEDDAEIIRQLEEECQRIFDELEFPTKEEYSKMIDELTASQPLFEEILKDIESNES